MNFAHSDYSDLNLMEQKCSLVDGEGTEYAELLSFMAQVQVLAQQKGDEDLLYDVNAAIGNITVYMQHQVRDA